MPETRSAGRPKRGRQQFGQLHETPFCPEKSAHVLKGEVQTLGPRHAQEKFPLQVFGTSTQ